MFSPEQTSNSRSQRLGRPISIRLARLVFAVLALLACLRPAESLATSDGAPAGGAAAISGANFPAEARTAAPFASASGPAPNEIHRELRRQESPRFRSGPADLSDQPSGSTTPAFSASDPPYYVSDPPSALLQSDNRPIHRLPATNCLLLIEGLCQAMKNKPILALTTIQAAALVSDGVTTRQFLRRGYTEVDPVARILIGSKPTWARMAPLGAAQVIAGMWLAQRMATSRHVWVRRFWWLPQIMGIAGNLAATGHNIALH